MRRSFLTSIIAVTALAFCAAAMTPAEARKRGKKKYYSASKARTLTVRKRSFLDSGKHPLPGEKNGYVTQFTHFNTLPYSYNDALGRGPLPGPFGVYGPR